MTQKDLLNTQAGRNNKASATNQQPSKNRTATPSKDANAMQRNKMDRASSTGRRVNEVEQGDPSADRD